MGKENVYIKLIFFTKFSKHEMYIHLKGCYPQNSTHVNLASCDMYLQRFLDFFGNDENFSIMTQNDPENEKNLKISQISTF